jgi:hypothetical protein
MYRLHVCTAVIVRYKAKFTIARITTRKEYFGTQQYVTTATLSPANELRKRSKAPATFVDFDGHWVKPLSALERDYISISHSHMYS